MSPWPGYKQRLSELSKVSDQNSSFPCINQFENLRATMFAA